MLSNILFQICPQTCRKFYLDTSGSRLSRMSDRFVDSAVSELQNANRSPIYGFQHFPLVSLESAVESIIPFVPELITYVLHNADHILFNIEPETPR